MLCFSNIRDTKTKKMKLRKLRPLLISDPLQSERTVNCLHKFTCLNTLPNALLCDMPHDTGWSSKKIFKDFIILAILSGNPGSTPGTRLIGNFSRHPVIIGFFFTEKSLLRCSYCLAGHKL